MNDRTFPTVAAPLVDEDGFDVRWAGAVIRKEHWHFHRRLLARYGIVLAPREFSRITAAIRNGDALIVKVRVGTSSVYSVRVENARRSIFVLADRGGRLFTTLPPGSKHYHLKKAALRSAARKAGDPVVIGPPPPRSG